MKTLTGRLRLSTALVVAGAVAALSAGPGIAADGELTLFEWSGYEDPAFHPRYLEKHGDSPTFTFFGDEDEAFEKLRAGFKADLAHPCSQSVVKWREAGLLQPLDTSRIEGWDDILPGLMAMKDLATTADGQAWFMPWDWGNTSLTYNTEKITLEEVGSLRAFADPKFKDRVSLPDNVDDAYALASLVIGLKDWTQMTDAQFEEASAFLREVHENVRLYWTDATEIIQALGGGEVDLAWAWNDASTQLSNEGQPFAMNKATEEGVTTWVCGYVHLKDAPGSVDKVYDYLSAVNADPDVANYLVNDWGYGHGNEKAMAAVDEEILKDKGYADVEAFVDKTLFQSPLPPELKQRMIAEFEKIKAGY
jgi:spermidine/putrescine-binding protein